MPVMVYAVSAGPLQRPAAQKAGARGARRVRRWYGAGAARPQLLEEVGVHARSRSPPTRPSCSSPSRCPRTRSNARAWTSGRRLVGMSVREPGAAAPDIGEAATTGCWPMPPTSWSTVTTPISCSCRWSRRGDTQQSHAVVAQMRARTAPPCSKGEYTSAQLLSLMKRFDFAVGMRLHFLIFASLQNVPFVALPYAPKVDGFLEDLEIDHAATLAGQRGPAHRLYRHAWDRRRNSRRGSAGRCRRCATGRAKEQRDRGATLDQSVKGSRGRRDRHKAGVLCPPPRPARTARRSPCRRARPGRRRRADVLVVGGGPAGLGAALGAADAGAEVILVERYGFLGGNATAALVSCR